MENVTTYLLFIPPLQHTPNKFNVMIHIHLKKKHQTLKNFNKKIISVCLPGFTNNFRMDVTDVIEMYKEFTDTDRSNSLNKNCISTKADQMLICLNIK